jgi:hypothetical protein
MKEEPSSVKDAGETLNASNASASANMETSTISESNESPRLNTTDIRNMNVSCFYSTLLKLHLFSNLEIKIGC